MTIYDSHSSIPEETQNKTGETNNPGRHNHDCCLPSTKKARLLTDNDSSSPQFYHKSSQDVTFDHPEKNLPSCWLFSDYNDSLSSKMPSTLSPNWIAAEKTHKNFTKIGHSLEKLRRLLDTHGLRTTKISSPREAVSIYKDSFRMIADGGNDDDMLFRDGKEFLLVTFGFHPHQAAIEKKYERTIKNSYCILLFCKKIREQYLNLLGLTSNPPVNQNTSIEGDKNLQKLLNQIDQIHKFAKENESSGISSTMAKEHANTLIDLAVNVECQRRYRKEEWRKEYRRICISNSTISNAYIFLLQSIHGMCIKEIHMKCNQHEPKYERVTVYLYDPNIDEGRRPDFFLFLPGLHTVVTRGPHELVSDMVESFWAYVLRNGYFPTTKLRKTLEPQLRCFFSSGITTGKSNNLPIPLNANFNPKFPLSIYLHGKAGSGKSSLAKVLPTALQNTLQKHVDPECIARFVKQNLNKCIKTLELEFELRPNNNDMSIMSIVQGRRMTMSQSKPGLVVLNLEEVPMYSPENNPDQLSVAQLISQRFGGRKGSYQVEKQKNFGAGRYKSAPRNSDKRSIGKDYSLVTIFTSNYQLAEASKQALEQLELYQSLITMEMSAISGSDRCQFAKSYLRQCLLDSLGENISEFSTSNLTLDISYSDGDTRPLVRQLRMYAYYLRKVLSDMVSKVDTIIEIKGIQITQNQKICFLTMDTEVRDESTRRFQQQLKMGSMSNWYPACTYEFDRKTKLAMDKLNKIIEGDAVAELAVILEFWFSSTLAPTVILSQDRKVVQSLMDAIECMSEDIHCIRNINTETYKMIKSLYDPRETPNLRDDILRFGPGALVATELICPTTDSQLCIREMIEDSPSMTAFSSNKSALYKSGLLFAIYIGEEITPEILSRVSIII